MSRLNADVKHPVQSSFVERRFIGMEGILLLYALSLLDKS